MVYNELHGNVSAHGPAKQVKLLPSDRLTKRINIIAPVPVTSRGIDRQILGIPEASEIRNHNIIFFFKIRNQRHKKNRRRNIAMKY